MADELETQEVNSTTNFKIKSLKQNFNGSEYEGNFTADSNDIYIEAGTVNNKKVYHTLQTFFDNWEDFKANNAFMYHETDSRVSAPETNLPEQIRFWYKG